MIVFSMLLQRVGHGVYKIGRSRYGGLFSICPHLLQTDLLFVLCKHKYVLFLY